MVIVRSCAGLCVLVRRGVGDHIAACDKIDVSARKQLPQAGKIVRHGDIDGDLVWEQICIPLVGGRNGDNAAAQELGERFLAPRELVDGEIDLEAACADLLHDLLMADGKRVERAGEKRGGFFRREAERPLQQLLPDGIAVQMVEHGRAVEECQLAGARFCQKRQELFVQTDENIMLSGKRELVAAENIAAEDGQRRLVDRLVIVGNAGKDEAEDVISDLRLLLRQHIQRLAERKQRHACRPDGRAAGKLSDRLYRLAQLLFRQQAQKPSQIRRDEARDLLLPGFQLARQVDADLVDLVDEQIGGHRKQRIARRLTHGKMLADAEQIGKMQRRVERRLRVRLDIFQQHIDLRELDRPVDGVFQVAEVDLRDGPRVQRRERLRQQPCFEPVVGQMILPARRVLPHGGADGRPQALLGVGQAQEHMQRDDIQLRVSRAEHGGKAGGQLRQLLFWQIAARHMAQRVDQHEPVFVPRLGQRVQKRLDQRPGLLFLAGGKQALADGLERVGDAQRVLAGNAVIRVQAEADIMCPKLGRFRQKRHHGGRHLAVLRRKRPLLAVARAGIRKNFAHDAPGDAAHVAVRVHEKLIQEHKRLALVGLGHIGAVFLQQAQVHSDPLEIFFALACSSSCSSVWSVESVCMSRMEPSSVRSRSA